MKDAAQDAAQDVAQGVVQDVFAFGARGARILIATPSPPPPPSLRNSRLAEMGAQLGSPVAFNSGCGHAQSASMLIYGKAQQNTSLLPYRCVLRMAGIFAPPPLSGGDWI